MLQEKVFKHGGVFPAMVTPFSSNGDLFVKALDDYVPWLITKGAHGLFVCGTCGEGPIMDKEDRKKTLERTIELVQEKIPVIAHIGAKNTANTIELAKHAEKVGADAVAAITPFYFHPNEDALVKHYQELGRSVKIPFFLYNLPSFTTNTFPAKRLNDFKDYPNFAGIKDTSKDLVLFLDYMKNIPKQGVVIMGADRLFVTALSAGSPGMVSSVASAFPDLFVPIFDNFKKGNLAEAQKHQMKIVDICDILREYQEIAPFKSILRMRGIDVGSMLSPLGDLTHQEEKSLRKKLEEINIQFD
ncbi:MAG: dihydrodipicolinate synthase family protein [Candidatus Ranarchaeia archaeon]